MSREFLDTVEAAQPVQIDVAQNGVTVLLVGDNYSKKLTRRRNVTFVFNEPKDLTEFLNFHFWGDRNPLVRTEESVDY